MEVVVNLWAVIAAALSTMVVGSIWYAKPVFGSSWEKMVGLSGKKNRQSPTRAIGITLAVSFASAYVLAHFISLAHSFYNGSFLMDSITTAFWAWLGFTAARFITHDAFEERPLKLTVMNISHELATFLTMGLTIGLIGI